MPSRTPQQSVVITAARMPSFPALLSNNIYYPLFSRFYLFCYCLPPLLEYVSREQGFCLFCALLVCRAYHKFPLAFTVSKSLPTTQTISSHSHFWSMNITSFHLGSLPQVASVIAPPFPSVLYHFRDIFLDYPIQNSTPSFLWHLLTFLLLYFFLASFITPYILLFIHIYVLFVNIVYGLTSLKEYKSHGDRDFSPFCALCSSSAY